MRVLWFPRVIWITALFVLVLVVSLFFGASTPAALKPIQADTANVTAGATNYVRIVKYADDDKTILADKTVDYQWMEQNLPVYGDGETHYYLQGPVFEGDMWDPTETVNLKDKGALKGTDLKDLCDLVGGMKPGGELVIHAIDGYEMTLSYDNIYKPPDIQGPVVLCWYKGKDTGTSDEVGFGYPGNNAFSSALQIIFMPKTANQDGQFVFGNSDMKTALPQEKYQHFYEGLPSTNGLSTKWVSLLRIYQGAAPTVAAKATAPLTAAESTTTDKIPWVPISLGSAGLLLVALSGYIFSVKRGSL